MTNAQLIEFADQSLGIVIPKDSPRANTMAKIVNAAMGSR